MVLKPFSRKRPILSLARSSKKHSMKFRPRLSTIPELPSRESSLAGSASPRQGRKRDLPDHAVESRKKRCRVSY